MLTRQLLTIGFLVVSNVFMTMAWYGHLKFSEWGWFPRAGLFATVLISWGMAFLNTAFRFRPTESDTMKTEGHLTWLNLK